MFKNFIEQFVFFPQKEIQKTPQSIGLGYEDIYLENNHGWFIGNKKKNVHKSIKNKVILFFHGNAGNIGFRLNYIKKFNEIGFSLLFFDYPGFGYSKGSPSEETCVNTGILYYQFLLKLFPHENIIFYGESIGGAIAANVANKFHAKHLILQSTFTDIKQIIKNLLVTNYLNYFIGNIGFETIKYLQNRHRLNILEKKMKTFIIHSNNDEIIDISFAMELEKYANGLCITNGTHSNIEFNDDLIYQILKFIG